MHNLGTILIVDDEPNDAHLVGIAFREQNCCNPIQVVTDGEEAIRYLARSGKFLDRVTYPFPVLLLLDLKMPRRDGFEVLRWLNRQPEIKATLKVVVWSSFLTPDSTKALQELGVEVFFEKPLRLDELRDQIRALKERWPDVWAKTRGHSASKQSAVCKPCPFCGALVNRKHLGRHKSRRCPKAPPEVIAARLPKPIRVIRPKPSTAGQDLVIPRADT